MKRKIVCSVYPPCINININKVNNKLKIG
uniref:Uncharacterized protein n=1 Tax=Anguilla anguilla TaxID=7936 RepID=A0A0E9TAM7_ANGAN